MIDGLVVSNWSREMFAAMHGAGYTAVSCTCVIWEDFEGTMANIAPSLKTSIDESSDLVRQLHTGADIAAAHEEGKVGIILSWQNISDMEDDIQSLRLFRDLVIRIIQLAYNTQNLVGAGCYETNDSGLSDFGRDVIDSSTRPVALSHTCPAALKPHRRGSPPHRRERRVCGRDRIDLVPCRRRIRDDRGRTTSTRSST